MTKDDIQTEEKIFKAATVVFEEKGLTGARMKDIADRAGINKALLHYYFRTKNLLFSAVFTKLAQKLFAKFSPVLEKDLTLEEKIRFFVREHIDFLKQNPRLPGFIINEINQNPERLRKLISKIDIKKIWAAMLENHTEELKRYNISEESIPQIMTSIVSLTIFPFAARGILEVIFRSVEVDFDDYIEERKEFLADFIINALSN
jgi:TetR/AcrR family transcriptional regulator